MIKQISLREHSSKIQELSISHWEEVATNKHSRKLNLDVEAFFLLEDKGFLISLGAFIDNSLIGYSISAFVPDMHDRSKLLCINDAIFILEDYRNGSIGIKLIKETETLAKARGAYALIWHAKVGTALDKLLPKLSYEVKDILHMKEL
jgi:GNAT superfamily N-acetyltransferase